MVGLGLSKLWVYRPFWVPLQIRIHTNTPTTKKALKRVTRGKKPHYHLVFLFDSLKSSAQVKGNYDKIKGLSVNWKSFQFLDYPLFDTKIAKIKHNMTKKIYFLLVVRILKNIQRRKMKKTRIWTKLFSRITNLCGVLIYLWRGFPTLVIFFVSKEMFDEENCSSKFLFFGLHIFQK